MVPYFLLVLLPVIIWLGNEELHVRIGNRLLYKTKSLSIDVFMLIFLFLLAFRGLECGIDTKQYFRLYKEYSLISFSDLFSTHNHEIAYKLTNKIIGVTANSFQVLLIIMAFLSVVPLWYFFKKESENTLLTIALFLSVSPFVMYFSGIRQAVSMSIGVLAWYAAKNKKISRFIILVSIAILFHTSAFVLFIIYPLYHARISKKWLWFVIPSMMGIYFFRKTIFSFLMTFLWKDYQTTAETGAFMVLLLLIVFSIYSYIMVDDSTLDQDTIALRNMLLLSVCIQIFAMLHPLSMRMNYYFLIFVPVLIPKIAKNCKSQYAIISKLSVVVMIVYFLGRFFSNMLTDNDDLNIFPYIPFWENM